MPLRRDEFNASRRKFIKTAGILGASGVLAASIPGTVKSAIAGITAQPYSVAIVGAGLAGLNAAYQLKKAGILAQVYEANTRLGGRVFSKTGLVGDGIVSEMGAEFINSDHEDMLQLAADFNLKLFNRREEAETLEIPGSAYYCEGASWPESELVELLRPLVAQITRDADAIDQDWDKVAPKIDRHSVSDYLDQYAALIPQPFIRTLIENTIRTEYGVEPEKSTALQLLFNLPTIEGNKVELLGYSDEAFIVEGGNDQIIAGLEKALTGQIHTQKALVKLEQEGKQGYELTFNSGESIKADYVIVAIPFTALRRVKMEVRLPLKLRKFIEDVDLGRNEKVMAGFNERAWRNAKGFSLEAWTDFGCSEVWDGAQRQVDRSDGALTYYLGGREVKILQDKNAAETGREFNKRLSAFIPNIDSASNGKFARTHWTGNPHSRGAYVSFKPGQLTRYGSYLWIESDDPEEQQAVQVGRLVFAGEQVSDEYYGFMNGGAQTGRLAAQWIQQDALTAKARA